MTETQVRRPLPRTPSGDLGVRSFMVGILRGRMKAIEADPSLIKSNPWPSTKAYYDLRKLLDKLGYDIAEVYPPGHRFAGNVILADRRKYIQGAMLTDICEKEFGKKRHEIGIFVDERTQYAYKGNFGSVGFYDIDRVSMWGTDIVLCEKAYAVKTLAPLARPYGIVLLECGGNFVEYAKMLCEKAHGIRNCNVGILTDLDISGIAMCLKIPWATRIGIGQNTIDSLRLTDEERRDVQERYNADPGQMKFVTDTLNMHSWTAKKDLPEDAVDYLTRHSEYNLELIRSLNLDQGQTIEYLTETRIELDHVIDIVGPDRFFAYLKRTMEDRFHDRDYFYAINYIKTNEIFPFEVNKFIADLIGRCRKLLRHNKEIRKKYDSIIYHELSEIEGIQPIEDERDTVIGELTEVAEKVTKYKKMVSELQKILDKSGLPELTKEEQEASDEEDENYYLHDFKNKG